MAPSAVRRCYTGARVGSTIAQERGWDKLCDMGRGGAASWPRRASNETHLRRIETISIALNSLPFTVL